MTVALSKVGAGLVVQPRDMNELWTFCTTIAKSSFVPKDFRDRPGDVLAAIQMGAELGLAPMAALQNICVINGRPSVWGDALLAVILAHPECKELEETFDAKTKTARCRIVRQRANGNTRTTEEEFSWADAEAAKLTSKDTYKQYGKRMLKMRARGFAVRDAFPDVLKGLVTREEAQDIPSNALNEPTGVVEKVPPAAIDATPKTVLAPVAEGPRFNEKWEPEQWGGRLMSEADAAVLQTYIDDVSEMMLATGMTPAKLEYLSATKAAAESAKRALRTSDATTEKLDETLNAAAGGAPLGPRPEENEAWGV